MRVLGIFIIGLASLALLFRLVAVTGVVDYPLVRLIYLLANVSLTGALALGGVGLIVLAGQPVAAMKSLIAPGVSGSGMDQGPLPAQGGASRGVSKGLYLGFMIGGFTLWCLLVLPLAAIYAEGRGRDRQVVTMLMCPAALPLLAVAIFQIMLIYKMWAVLPGRFARATPGQAVGLLFVPLFNLYWVFQAYWGWTKDYNTYVAARGINGPRMPEGLALTICILALGGALPVVGVGLAIVNLILILIFFSRCIDGINALALARSTA